MPQLGSGLIANGPIGFELEATIRRVFTQYVVVQIYKQNPTLALMLRNAVRASGGVSPITQPAQMGKYVNSSWMGPAGNFDIPPDLAATVNAEYNLCALATPVTSFGLEQLVTQDAVAVASRLMLKMNDMKNASMEALCRAIFTSSSNTADPDDPVVFGDPDPLKMFGFWDAYGNAGRVPFYGGLNRNTYPRWAGHVVESAGDVLEREKFIPFLLRCARNAGGEAPDFCVMSIQDWTKLMTDFMSVERYNNDPSVRWGKEDPVNSGFRGLLLGDTPIFFDLQCPKGTAFLFNSRYITLFVHEDANWAWTGWYSTIPQGQIASVGLTLTALQLVCSKPATGLIIHGITGGVDFD